ncbi:MAG: ABC transporter ATP-binding protein [Tissierellia bacterium]|nr:ABC transporter ATP-binding protein [Tissierellia bacterium]
MHRRRVQTDKKINFKNLKRLLSMLFEDSKLLLSLVFIAIIFSAITRAIPSIYMQRAVAVVDKYWKLGTWEPALEELMPLFITIAVVIILALISTFFYTRAMAVISQSFLKRLRTDMFDLMQELPISFFDTNQHGDVMSRYTNDIDALRQFIAMTLPQTIASGVLMISVLAIMLWYSIWLFLVVLLGVFIMFFVTAKIGGNSAKYFRKQQDSLGKAEGFIEEIMHGQKVVKVFNQEDQVLEKFDALNERLFKDAKSANVFGNVLMPIMFNLGNIIYVSVAIVGAIMVINQTPNLSLSGSVISISIVIPFLNMTKQFAGNLGMLSNQINLVAMATAAAERIFEILDKEPEEDNGKIRLVRVIKKDGDLIEHDTYTGHWAWKIKNDDGSFSYTELKGEVILDHVNFGYVKDKLVLKDISLFAKPGQKVAFVGATGAGKTTITNLINRFYDINSGTITYDGIDIKKIRKGDLRRSMGLVLQDTNLFSGSVMDNIRYGNLGASDEQCIAAARLTGAHSFISRLPEGYNTYIDGNNDSLSQGQRQLISIARAAVADPPVMVLDEATSSIDTRTESIVQRGMDSLMMGRTVFVIAHRLSTIRNSDVIMLLDQGRIIERGNHEDLMAKKGRYYELYTGGFELD